MLIRWADRGLTPGITPGTSRCPPAPAVAATAGLSDGPDDSAAVGGPVVRGGTVTSDFTGISGVTGTGCAATAGCCVPDGDAAGSSAAADRAGTVLACACGEPFAIADSIARTSITVSSADLADRLAVTLAGRGVVFRAGLPVAVDDVVGVAVELTSSVTATSAGGGVGVRLDRSPRERACSEAVTARSRPCLASDTARRRASLTCSRPDGVRTRAPCRILGHATAAMTMPAARTQTSMAMMVACTPLRCPTPGTATNRRASTSRFVG